MKNYLKINEERKKLILTHIENKEYNQLETIIKREMKI